MGSMMEKNKTQRISQYGIWQTLLFSHFFCFRPRLCPPLFIFPFLYLFATHSANSLFSCWMLALSIRSATVHLEKSWSKLLSFLLCSRFVLFHFQSYKKVRKGCKYGWEFIRFHSASLVCLVGFFCLLMNGAAVVVVFSGSRCVQMDDVIIIITVITFKGNEK